MHTNFLNLLSEAWTDVRDARERHSVNTVDTRNRNHKLSYSLASLAKQIFFDCFLSIVMAFL